jgi:hypothetical protein
MCFASGARTTPIRAIDEAPAPKTVSTIKEESP